MLGLALSALAGVVLAAQARALYRELDAALAVQVEQLAAERQSALLSIDPGQALLEDPPPALIPVCIRQVSGEEIFRSPAFPDLDWAGRGAAAGAARGPVRLLTVSGARGGSFRLATWLVMRPGTTPLAVQLVASTGPIRETLGQLAIGMVFFVIIMLAVASFGGSRIVRRALAPVDAVVQRVERIQAGQLQDRLEVPTGSEEVDRLVATLNRMLDRIGASVRAARRFAGDASHELQTPLAALRGALEICLRNGQRPTDGRVPADLLAEVDRLSALIRDLRFLALAEAGQMVEKPEPVDLAALATECAEIAQALAEEKAIHVGLWLRPCPVVVGSPTLLRRVVLNLLENAVRYSAPATQVTLSVGTAKGQAMLSVLDHGCGIEAADLQHIFEPFYRADPARARDSGGTGLGLAIMDEIVRLHGGEVRVSSTPKRGSSFVVYLPARPAASPSIKTA
jgi:two-component system OmpR family sensor kinase